MNRLPLQARVRLLFQDEARFGCVSHQRRCWARWLLRPIVGQQVLREFLYGLAAVSPLDGQLCSLVLPWMDTETMSPFLAPPPPAFPTTVARCCWMAPVGTLPQPQRSPHTTCCPSGRENTAGGSTDPGGSKMSGRARIAHFTSQLIIRLV